jgi:hypothetical protein
MFISRQSVCGACSLWSLPQFSDWSSADAICSPVSNIKTIALSNFQHRIGGIIGTTRDVPSSQRRRESLHWVGDEPDFICQLVTRTAMFCATSSTLHGRPIQSRKRSTSIYFTISRRININLLIHETGRLCKEFLSSGILYFSDKFENKKFGKRDENPSVPWSAIDSKCDS